MRAVTRRVAPLEEERPIVTADFTMHLADRRLVRSDGAEVTLSPTEWRLIEVLVQHVGHLVTREELLRVGVGPAGREQDAVPARAHGEHPPKSSSRIRLGRATS